MPDESTAGGDLVARLRRELDERRRVGTDLASLLVGVVACVDLPATKALAGDLVRAWAAIEKAEG